MRTKIFLSTKITTVAAQTVKIKEQDSPEILPLRLVIARLIKRTDIFSHEINLTYIPVIITELTNNYQDFMTSNS